MDPEITENITLNATFDPESTVPYDPLSYWATIPTVIVALGRIIANAIIILLVVKFRNLKTSSTYYIINWSICNIGVLVLAPSNYHVFSGVEYVVIELFCVWFGNILVFLIGNLAFVGLMAVDWYVLNYCSQSRAAKHRKSYLIQIIVVWVILVGLSTYFTIRCTQGYFLSTVWGLMLLVNFVTIVLVLLFYLVKCVKRRTSSVFVLKSKLIPTLVLSYVLRWLPNNFMLVVDLTIEHNSSIIREIVLLTNAIAYSNSILVLFLLYTRDKCFKESLETLCNCSRETGEKEVEDGSLESVDIKSRDYLK